MGAGGSCAGNQIWDYDVLGPALSHKASALRRVPRHPIGVLGGGETGYRMASSSGVASPARGIRCALESTIASGVRNWCETMDTKDR